MAKQTNAAATNTEVATTTPAATTALSLSNMNLDAVNQVLGLLETADEEPISQVVSADFYKFVEGDVNLIFVESITTFTDTKFGDGEEKACVSFQMKKDGLTGAYLNADKVFVSTMQQQEKQGFIPGFYKVVNRGEKKGENGKYADLLISRFILKSETQASAE